MDEILDVSPAEEVEAEAQPVADPRYGRSGMAVNAAIVMAMTLVSGLLGVLREAAVAGHFGGQPDYAAYLTALGIPNFIYAIVVGGALGSAFIPVFSAYLAKRDDEQTWRLASSVLNIALVVALAVALLVFALTPLLIRWVLAPGLTPSEQALAARLGRLLLLQPILLGIGGLAMAILNTFRRFLLTALAPIVYNLGIIAGVVFLAPRMGIYGLVVGVLFGAALYIPVLLPGLFLSRMRYRLTFDWQDPGVREVGRLLLPRLVGQAVVYINQPAILALATLSTGAVPGVLAVAAINYALTLFRLPFNMLGTSLGTVSFPTFAAQANEGRLEDMRATLARILRVTLFITLPLSALVLVLRGSIIHLLYERGVFTPDVAQATAAALLFFILGLAAASATEVIVRSFYALHDTRTPVIVGMIIVAVNVGLGFGLLHVLGFVALPLSFTLTNTAETIALLVLLRRKIQRIEATAMLASGARSLAAAALSAGAVALLLPLVERLLPGSGLIVQAVRLGGLSVVGAGLYLGLAAALRSPEIGEAWALLHRRGRA